MRFAGTVISGQRRAYSAVAAVVLTLSGCVAGPAAGEVDSINKAAARRAPDGSDSYAYVSPDGSAWLYRTDDELCVRQRTRDDAKCTAWQQSLATTGVSWSADNARVLFTQDSLPESDVFVMNVATGQLEALTEDFVDEYRADGAVPDVAPFFGPGDEIYFFRLIADAGGGGRWELYRFGDKGAAPVAGDPIGDDAPIGTPLHWYDNTWIYQYFDGEGGTSRLTALTFAGEGFALDPVWSPPEQMTLVDANTGQLLMRRNDVNGLESALFVVNPGQRTSVELLHADESGDVRYGSIDGRFSSSGQHVLMVETALETPVRLTLWELGTDGGLPTAVPASVVVVDEALPGVAASGIAGGLGWDDNTTLVVSGREGVVEYELDVG